MLFHDPWILWLVLGIPLFYRWWFKRQLPARVRFPVEIPKTLISKSPYHLFLILRVLSIALMLVALARPQRGFVHTERTVSGIDIDIILDVSASMNIEDLAERSRIDVAKDTIETFIKGRQTDRIGLVIFSGEPMTMAPPTLDYGLLLRALRQVSIGVLRDGTAIGDGLALTVSHLKTSRAQSRVIILLTDGDNNVGQVDPATAGELAAGFGIRVYTIAIGREGRVRMPVHHRGFFGNPVTTYQWVDNALNTELLEKIAKDTRGKFYRVTDESALASVFQEIDQMEKTDIKTKQKTRYDELYQKPLQLGLLLLFLGLILERVWWRMIP